MVLQAQGAKSKTVILPGDVKITYQTGDYDFGSGKWTFDNGVIVDYDVTEVRADHVDIDVKGQVGSASGHVQLDDPVATVRASKLEFSWNPTGRHGHADDADVHLGSTHIKAKTLDLGPTLWVMTEVEITTSRANPPWYELHTPYMTIKPGQSGRMKKPTLYLLGHKIVTGPDRSFNLDQRSEGLTFPGLNYSRQYGLGASWGGGFLLNHATDIAFSVGAFPNTRPGLGISVSKSFLSDTKPTALLTPESDWGERFSHGFMDNIAVSTPESADRYMRSPRQTISVDTVWNQFLIDRGTNNTYNKAGEVVYELGGPLGAYGYVSQFRLQTLQEFGTPLVTRGEFVDALGAPAIKLTSNLRTLARIDSDVFVGGHEFGWVRGFAGLSYLPIPQLRVSGGGYYSQQAGSPQYPIDPLYSKAGFALRADLNLGPTKLGFLQKYDETGKWFDKEYTISQVVGCFEPYLLYRKNPSDYLLGLRLRLDNLTDLMSQRNFKRPKTVATVISPGPDGKP